MLIKHGTLLSAIILFLFGLTTVSPVFASGFGDRLSKCNSKKSIKAAKDNKNKAKVECYQKLVSDIIARLKKECGSQYANLTTKIKGHKRTTFSKARDYCSKGKKLECFKELAKKSNKQFDYYEETSYCKWYMKIIFYHSRWIWKRIVIFAKGDIMSDKYLKIILISAVGGLYMIAYSLFYIGTRLSHLG